MENPFGKPAHRQEARKTCRAQREQGRGKSDAAMPGHVHGVQREATRRVRDHLELVGSCTHKLDLDDQCYHVARRCRLGDLVPMSYRVQGARFYRVSVLPGLWAVAASKRRCPLGLRGGSESLSLGQGRSPEGSTDTGQNTNTTVRTFQGLDRGFVVGMNVRSQQ